MRAAVLLDAGPLGLLTNPNNNSQAIACTAWLASIRAVGRQVFVPEITDYEVRRELIRIQSHSALGNLDALGTLLNAHHLVLGWEAARADLVADEALQVFG